jgi:hypothetical protein
MKTTASNTTPLVSPQENGTAIIQPHASMAVGHQNRTARQGILVRLLCRNQIKSRHNPTQASANRRPTRTVCQLRVSSPGSRGSHDGSHPRSRPHANRMPRNRSATPVDENSETWDHHSLRHRIPPKDTMTYTAGHRSRRWPSPLKDSDSNRSPNQIRIWPRSASSTVSWAVQPRKCSRGVLFLSTTIRLGRPRSSRRTPSSLMPISSMMDLPPVRMAMGHLLFASER